MNLKKYGLFLFITWICTLAAGVAQQAFGVSLINVEILIKA